MNGENMWQEHIDQGKKALNARDPVAAEASFNDALDYASRNFAHTDTRIPETFAFLGRALLFQRKVGEAVPALRQAVRIARSLKYESPAVVLADYLWACIESSESGGGKRRQEKLQALEKYMPAGRIEDLNKRLKAILTAVPERQEQAGQGSRQSSKGKPGTKGQGETEPKRMSEPESKSEAESGKDAAPQSDLQPQQSQEPREEEQPEKQAQPEPQAETGPEIQPEPQAEKQAEPSPELQPEPQPGKQAQPETGPGPKPEAKTAAHVEPEIKVYPWPEPGERDIPFNTRLAAAPKVKVQLEAKAEPVLPERYQAWAEKLRSTIERSKSYQMHELIASYLELHELMSETVEIYRPPHSAVADHLSALGELAFALGLFDRAGVLLTLALRNYEKTAGYYHLKTAYARLQLAQVYKELDRCYEADAYFGPAFNIIQSQPEIDKEWFGKVVRSFGLMMQREKIENMLFASVQEIDNLAEQRKYLEADQRARSLADKMAEVFVSDHDSFAYLYDHHAQVLAKYGREVESAVLKRLADYIGAKNRENREFHKAIEEILPDFDEQVKAALYFE
jgi:tetratricopeptide (TPR) repeat protein